MQTPRNWVGLAVFAAFTGASIACSDFTPPFASEASGLTVSPRSAHLNVGGTLQLNANGASGRVTWSSSDDSVATVSFGKVTALSSGTATIRAVSGTSHAISTITVTRAASIALSNSNVSFSAVPSGPVPDSQAVNVTNGGEDPLTGLQIAAVTYGSGATGWLTATLTQADAPSSLVLRPNTTALATGSYTATVSIVAASPSTPPQSVTVTFTLIRPGVISFGSNSATFVAQQNAGLPNPQSIEITNTGDAPLTGLAIGQISYSSGAASWLDAIVNPTTAPAQLTLHPNSATMAPGSYTATVQVTSTAPGVAAATMTVTYDVSPAAIPPAIEVSPTSLSFVAGRNFATLPPAKQIAVTSTGTGTVAGLSATSISYAAGASNWLNTTFVGGVTAPTTLNVQPNTTGLSAGMYTAIIHLTSTSPGVTTKDIPITYVVNDLVLDQSSIQFYSKSSTAPAAQVVTVSNSGSSSISGVTATVSLTSGRADASYIWLQSSISSTVPESGTALTLTVAHSDSLGSFAAVVTVSAPGMVSKSVNVSFMRQATMAGDIWPILHDSTVGTGTGKCVGCHSALTAADSSIDFSTSDQAYRSLVAPTFNGKTYFDTQADSAANFLYRIITGTAASTATAPNMPFSCLNAGSSCMHAGLRTRIYIWILQGALQQ